MRALWTNRNFILLFFGRLINNAGDSLYYLAAMWLAYKLGGSVIYSGLAGFLTMLPDTFSFLVGPFIDKWSLKKLLVIPSLVQGLLVLIIPILYAVHQLNVIAILILMPLLATVDLFPYPAENALIPQLVTGSQLIRANSLLAFAYQGTDLIFNSIGGILIIWLGAVTLYSWDAITFFTAMLLFACLRLKTRTHQTTKQPSNQPLTVRTRVYVQHLAVGFRFLHQPLIFSMLWPIIVCNFTLSAVLAILPGFSNRIGGSGAYGMMLAGYTGGFLLGTLFSSLISRHMPMGHLMVLGYGASGLLWILATSAASFSLSLSCALLVLANFPIGVTNMLFTTFFQTIPPRPLIGRVSAAIESLIACAMPAGSLAGGFIAHWTGNASILIGYGAMLLLVACHWQLHQQLRTTDLNKPIKLTDVF
ncbi:MAG: MFS transporter [Sporolactobacillus sp.]